MSRPPQGVGRHRVKMPVVATGVVKHASGHSPVPLAVAGTLKHPVLVAVSMQHLDGLMLSGPTFTPSPGQQKERPGPDVGQRGGEPQSSDTTNNLDTQITRTQASHVGQQERRRQANSRRW